MKANKSCNLVSLTAVVILLIFASCATVPTTLDSTTTLDSITTLDSTTTSASTATPTTPATTVSPVTTAASQEGTTTMIFANQTDITDALEEAIRQAPDGGIVTLPAGEFYITDRIRLSSNVTVAGSGQNQTTLTVARNGLFSVFWAERREKIVLRDFTINAADTAMKTVIDLERCSQITIDSLTIRDMNGLDSSIAIHFQTTTDSQIRNCTFHNISVHSEWGCAIRLSEGSSRNLVELNTIADTGRGGILCDNNSTHLTIIGNTVSGSGKTSEGLGIEIWGGCAYSLIEDNVIDHWLSIDNSSYTAVRRNLVSDKSGDVKFLGLEVVGSTDVICTDNRIDHGQYIGLSSSNVDPKEYTYWGNNEVFGCQQWGAQFQGEEGFVRHQYFYNLTIADTYKDRDPIYPNDAGHGFRFNENCEYFMFEGGRIANNAGLGIQLLGHVADVYFLDTIFENNARQKESVIDSRRVDESVLPIVQFSCQTAVQTGETVEFTNQSEGNSGEIDRVLWDFGAGLPAADFNPVFTYDQAGVYTVSLVVWNTAGYAYRAEKTITVNDP